MWARHSAEWRDSAQICSLWQDAQRVHPRLLRYHTRGAFWETIERLRLTLLVTREYEHLVMALGIKRGRPRVSYLPLPHPSGLASDRARNVLHVASTRNPNQVLALGPVESKLSRTDIRPELSADRPLVPLRSTFYPGCLYMHDLALIRGRLYANSVGQNAIVELGANGGHERVWWPKCIDSEREPRFGANYIQLNSIAAGASLEGSYFSASSDRIRRFRPGDLRFPVDRKGVIFSARTREPICRDLTRPHSARLHERQVWVANSGYGEIGFVRAGQFEAVHRFDGWTRGLCFVGKLLFVATSRVIPRFSVYAPGLDVAKSRCGVHILDLDTGRLLGSLLWPAGNQIFAIDWMDAACTTGLPFLADHHADVQPIFYTFQA